MPNLNSSKQIRDVLDPWSLSEEGAATLFGPTRNSLEEVSVIPVTIALLFSQLTNFFENQKIEQVVHEQQLSTNTSGVLSQEGNDSGAAKQENAGASADSVRHPQSAQDNLLRTYLLWLVLTLTLVGGMPLQRYLVSVLDGKIGNAIRRDVFDSVLRQSPGFFFKYDSDRLTVVVNQLCIQASSVIDRSNPPGGESRVSWMHSLFAND
jgi:ABC-type multidrug transport system fused ATPase/permease subunit